MLLVAVVVAWIVAVLCYVLFARERRIRAHLERELRSVLADPAIDRTRLMVADVILKDIS